MKDVASSFDVCAWTCLTGSSSVSTRKLMTALGQRGWLGELSAALFRAQKASDRAKQYRAYSATKYGAKDDQVALLCKLLGSASMTWGWGIDKCGYLRDVLYIDLPNGQVSFHCPYRHDGPEYGGEWDSSQDSRENIANFIEAVIRDVEPDGTRPSRKMKPKTTFRCEYCQSEKSSSQKMPPHWIAVHHHGDELATCSTECRSALMVKLDELHYTVDYAMPSGKHQGVLLGEVPEDYLFFCRDKIESEESVLRQAARAELKRRFPGCIIKPCG